MAHSPCSTADRSSRPRLVIAGFGLLTPLGQSAWETFRALLAGRTIADRTAAAGDRQAMDDGIDPVEMVRALGCVKLAQNMADDPAVELAERAAREACGMAGVAPRGLPTCLGTSKGAVTALAAAQRHLLEGSLAATHARPRPTAAARHEMSPLPVALGPHGYLTHRLTQRLGISPRGHHVAACASGLVALDHARRTLLHAKSEARNPKSQSTSHTANIQHATSNTSPAASDMLVITAEAALSPLFIHSYRRLGVLAKLHPKAYRQRPLDEDRQGFMLAEAGAAVVLRRLPPGVAPAPGQIELCDTAVACDAHDMIRPSPTMDGLRRVAARLLREPAGMIHPHAPGTPDHDAAEMGVYAKLLDASNDTRPPASGSQGSPSPRPSCYAAKGAVGHSLGASGLVSLVLACLCATTRRRPPMPWLTDPVPQMRAFDMAASTSGDEQPTCRRPLSHAVFAAGFGGHVAGATIRRW